MVKSTNSGLKVAAKLSPPLSRKINFKLANFLSNCSMATKLIEASSRIAVWGHPPVSTPKILSGAKACDLTKNWASS